MNRVKFISDSGRQVTVATEPQMIYVPQQQRQMARPYLEIERVIDMADSEFLREFQKKVEIKIRENEISVVQYWHERLGRLVSMKPDGIASLQLEIKKVYDMMENRIKTLKKG